MRREAILFCVDRPGRQANDGVKMKGGGAIQAFSRLLRMELRCAFQSGLFPAAYLAMLVTILLNIDLYSTTDSGVSAAYFLEYSFIGALAMLYYIWGVLPHGLSYYIDRRSGFLRQIVVRRPVKSYCTAKCCAAFLSSALSTALAVSTLLLILSFSRPLDHDIYLCDTGCRAWFPGRPVFYFIITTVILALGSGLFSILALWIATLKIPSRFWPRRFCSIIRRALRSKSRDWGICGSLVFPLCFTLCRVFPPRRRISSIPADICWRLRAFWEFYLPGERKRSGSFPPSLCGELPAEHPAYSQHSFIIPISSAGISLLWS